MNYFKVKNDVLLNHKELNISWLRLIQKVLKQTDAIKTEQKVIGDYTYIYYKNLEKRKGFNL